MKTNNDSRSSDQNSNRLRKPVAIVGAGKLTSSIWKTGDPRAGWRYRFNVFRLNPKSGHVTQQLTVSDVADLVKLARVLASTLADDGCLPTQQRQSLINLAADIDLILAPVE